MATWVNGKDLATHLGVTEGCITQLKTKGVLWRAQNKKYDLEESLKRYRASKKTAPRIDRAPGLPLGGPSDTVGPSDHENKKEANPVPPEVLEHQISYQKNRSKREAMRAESDELDLALKKARLVDKVPFMEAVRSWGMKQNAGLKSKLLAIPKRLALASPDPKMRPEIEETANDIINEILSEMSKIDPGAIDQQINPQT